MRRTSVSLPTKSSAYDPFEKPSRYNSAATSAKQERTGILENLKAAWMTQTQRARYVKTGGVLFFVLFLFFILSPKGTDVGLVGESGLQLSGETTAN